MYKLKYSKGEQGLFYLVSHALRGVQLCMALPLIRVSNPHIVKYVYYLSILHVHVHICSSFRAIWNSTVKQHVL